MLWIVLALSIVLSIVSFGFYTSAGLSTDERIQFNTIANNYTTDLLASLAVVAAAYPLEQTVANNSAAVSDFKNYQIPALENCDTVLEASIPLLLTDAATLQTQLNMVDLTPLATLQPLLNGVQSELAMLAVTFESGLITIHQQGTVLFANEANITYDSLNMTYQLESIALPQSARIYYVRVAASDLYLEISTPSTGAAVVFHSWNPPIVQTLTETPAVETILDIQRDKIAVLPSFIKFDTREYDLPNGRIVLRTDSGNFTQGMVVQVVDDLEMNLGLV